MFLEGVLSEKRAFQRCRREVGLLKQGSFKRCLFLERLGYFQRKFLSKSEEGVRLPRERG